MEASNVIRIGILYNAIVCSFVAMAAAMLSIFLFRRRRQLSSTMTAYAWFWTMTTFIWWPLAGRYFIIGLGQQTPYFYFLAVLTQIGLSMCGPPLIYYLTVHLHQKRFLVWLLTIIYFVLGVVGIWHDLQPSGLIFLPITFFSAEATLNPTSLYLYLAAISIIFLFLFIDITTQALTYFRQRHHGRGHEALYSMAIAAYLILGSLEVVAFITDWLVVVFRTFYMGAFLAVYLIMKNHEASTEEYFVKES